MSISTLRSKTFRNLTTAALATALALGCSFHSAQGDPTGTRNFVFRIQGEPETLDWNKAHTPIETYILMNLMEGLLTFDSSFKIAPALAQSWEISPDGKKFTFKLRTDVRWSDGVPLRAQDFVFSWKRLLSPVTAASYAYFLFDVDGAEDFNRGKIHDFSQVGVKALDDHTLEVRLAHPVATWIYIPTFWVTFPMREDIVEKYGSAWETPGRMVTLGPYTLASHDIDSKIVLKSNPVYYAPRGNIDQVTGLIVKDDSTALSLYEAGKLDFLTDIATLDLRRLQGRADLKSFPYLKTGYLGFVTDKFPLQNVKVRRAIAMAIDKSHLNQVLHGGQEAASSFVPPRMMGHSGKIGLPFNPARALEELKTSGVDLSKPLSIELLLPNWDKQLTLAQFIQGELKRNLKIDVQLQPFDNKTFRAQLDLHAFPLFEASWSADYPDPDNFLSVFLSTSGNNRTTWKSENFDGQIMKARGMQNQKAREKVYLDLQKVLEEDQVVIVPLYYEPNMALVRPRVKNLELNPLNYLLLRKVNLDS
ncbi:MAG: peptide ABC transporter substrate-binding protein [Bdellovibrionota bacterium]